MEKNDDIANEYGANNHFCSLVSSSEMHAGTTIQQIDSPRATLQQQGGQPLGSLLHDAGAGNVEQPLSARSIIEYSRVNMVSKRKKARKSSNFASQRLYKTTRYASESLTNLLAQPLTGHGGQVEKQGILNKNGGGLPVSQSFL